jgi:hypothetical protein
MARKLEEKAKKHKNGKDSFYSFQNGHFNVVQRQGDIARLGASNRSSSKIRHIHFNLPELPLT